MDELWRRIQDRSVQPRNLRKFRLLSLRMGVDTQERCAASHALVRPRNDAVFATGEGHVCFWMNLIQVN